ncbi:hypothetical protein N9B67_02780 [Algibacter sp.]|nr:hypothetical protein [Algibacter sp.]MDC1321772.1 hypothetical protein [bacterium]
MKKIILALTFGILFQLHGISQNNHEQIAENLTNKFIEQVESTITLEPKEKKVLNELKMEHMRDLIKVNTAHKNDPDVQEQRVAVTKTFVIQLREKIGVEKAQAILMAGKPKN